jgi:hypothetical protein
MSIGGISDVIPFPDIALEPTISWPSLIFWAGIFVLIYLRNKWDRFGPTRRQGVIMFFVLLLSLTPFLLVVTLFYQGILIPNLVGLTVVLTPVATFFLMAFVTAFGTKKRVEAVN